MTQTHDQIVKNIKGSFAIEGINISKQSLQNLQRLAKGSISCGKLISEIATKYNLQRG